MSKLVKKIRFFTIDQFEREAEYFKKMSARGLHLTGYSFPFYQFKQGEPQKMQYQTDFQHLDEESKSSYLQLFADDGWELIMEYGGVYGSWYYFRKMVTDDEHPQIFTDSESLLALYRKLRKNWLIFFLCLLPISFYPMLSPLFTDSLHMLSKFTIGLWLVLAALYLKITLNLTRKIQSIEKRRER